MRTNALLAVCRTAYRRVMAQTDGNIPAAKQAVRFDLERAGFQVASDDQQRTAGLDTVMVMLADGHYVQRNAFDRWYVKLYAAPGSPDDDAIPAGDAEDWSTRRGAWRR